MRKRKPTKPEPAPAEVSLLTDAQGAFELNLGISRFLDLQKSDPDFPAPVWLGPRGKRHVRSELLRYALSKRERVPA